MARATTAATAIFVARNIARFYSTENYQNAPEIILDNPGQITVQEVKKP
jgi:hypothetical protein